MKEFEAEDSASAQYWINKHTKLLEQLKWQIPLIAFVAFCAGVAFHKKHLETQEKKEQKIQSAKLVYTENKRRIVSSDSLDNFLSFEFCDSKSMQPQNISEKLQIYSL